MSVYASSKPADSSVSKSQRELAATGRWEHEDVFRSWQRVKYVVFAVCTPLLAPPIGSSCRYGVIPCAENLLKRNARLELRQQVDYKSQVGFEAWYELFKPYTMPSLVLRLSSAETLTLLRCQGAFQSGSEVAPSDLQSVVSLRARLDDAICTMKGGRAFIRSSTQSARDCIVDSSRWLSDRFKHECTELARQAVERGALDENALMIAYANAVGQAMCVRRGQEALELLVQSTQIHADLDEFLDAAKAQAIIVRRWEPTVKPESEFRVFVHHGRVSAISQDHDALYFRSLVGQKDALLRSICAFFSPALLKLGEGLGLEAYVADVSATTSSVVLIDINQWGTVTPALLFDWSMDRELLCGLGGQDTDAPPVFRIVEAAPSQATKRLQPHTQEAIALLVDRAQGDPDAVSKSLSTPRSRVPCSVQ